MKEATKLESGEGVYVWFRFALAVFGLGFFIVACIAAWRS